MPPKGSSTTSTVIFAEFEQEAYYACIEWPIYLLLRLRQLEAALQLAGAATTVPLN